MLNKCQFIGRLGQDIEMRYTTSGTAVGNVNIATSEKWKDKEGKKQEKTEWVRLVFWARVAEVVQQYTHKGSLIYVEGRMQTRQWDDRDGGKRYTTEVHVKQLVLLDSKDSSNKPPAPDEADAPPGSIQPPAEDLPEHGTEETSPGAQELSSESPEPPPESVDDDDLPF